MTTMLPRLKAAVRLAAVLLAGIAVSACMQIPTPKFGPGPPPLVTPGKIKALGPAPVTGEDVAFAFATVNGVPAEMRFALEDSLKRWAGTRHLIIVSEGDATAVYHVKGYLSAVGDTSGTLLVYTWDVADARGTPLYRISGQQTAAGSEADPWVGITAGEIDAAAQETIDKLADWARST